MDMAQQQQYGQRLTDLANSLQTESINPVDLAEDENASALSDHDCQQYIRQEVREALDRLENQTFGMCDACGEQISAERLDAMPYARYCASCGERLDPLFASTYALNSSPGDTRRRSDVIPLDDDDQPVSEEAEPDILP